MSGAVKLSPQVRRVWRRRTVIEPAHRSRRWSCRAARGAGESGFGPGGSAGVVLAEADGNRTRPPGIARRTGFEDREGHQPPFASRKPGPTPAWGRELYRERRRRGPQPPLRPSWPSIASRARLRSRPDE